MIGMEVTGGIAVLCGRAIRHDRNSRVSGPDKPGTTRRTSGRIALIELAQVPRGGRAHDLLDPPPIAVIDEGGHVSGGLAGSAGSRNADRLVLDIPGNDAPRPAQEIAGGVVEIPRARCHVKQQPHPFILTERTKSSRKVAR